MELKLDNIKVTISDYWLIEHGAKIR